MIKRKSYLQQIERALARAPIVALLGPRQCGKTTLAREFAKAQTATFFDLESPADVQRLQNPELMLGGLGGLIVIDEIQGMPALFPILRVLADRDPNPARFLILGSASPHLRRTAAESMAGRVEFVDIGGFTIDEIHSKDQQVLWVRGGFPRSFLAASEEDSVAWREGFIRTFLERDLSQLGLQLPAPTMRRFWTMLAHYHGQTWNASELGRSLGLSDKTVRYYLDVLTETYMIRQLQPWHVNVNKRQVKAPRIYFRDTGLLHRLLGLSDASGLFGHPHVGASWEGFAIEQALLQLKPPEAFFWATHGGAEVDLFFVANGRPYGIECKYSEQPILTRSMTVAMQTLALRHLWIVHPGKHVFPVSENVTACPLSQVRRLVSETTKGTVP